MEREISEAIFDTPRIQKVCGDCGGRCCNRCFVTSGYLTETEFEKVSRDYEFKAMPLDYCPDDAGRGWKNVDQGFFRAGRGCILPRDLRSAVCRSYACPDLKKEMRITHTQFMKLYSKITFHRSQYDK